KVDRVVKVDKGAKAAQLQLVELVRAEALVPAVEVEQVEAEETVVAADRVTQTQVLIAERVPHRAEAIRRQVEVVQVIVAPTQTLSSTTQGALARITLQAATLELHEQTHTANVME
ncbi:MAG: hypothetical protein RJB13_1415, partial [Pseudomonadota bacterium]